MLQRVTEIGYGTEKCTSQIILLKKSPNLYVGNTNKLTFRMKILFAGVPERPTVLTFILVSLY